MPKPRPGEGQFLIERKIHEARDAVRERLEDAGKLAEAHALAGSHSSSTECTMLLAEAIGRSPKLEALATTLAMGLGASGYLGRVFVAADEQVLLKLSRPMPDGTCEFSDRKFTTARDAALELGLPQSGLDLMRWVLSLEAVGGAAAAVDSLDRLGTVLDELERA